MLVIPQSSRFGLFWTKPAVPWLFPPNKVMTFKSSKALRESAAESQVMEEGACGFGWLL